MAVMFRIYYILFLTAAPLLLCPSGASSAEKVEDSWTFSLYFENDLFTNTDRAYTNGVKLSWASPDLTSYAESEKLPRWSLGLVRRLPYINEPGLIRNVAFSLGQNIYTPSDTARRELIISDRPYAGWAYGGVAFISKSARKLDSIEIQLGIVGPYSFAEESQKFVHSVRGFDRPMGWHNQIRNEPGIAVVYENKYRFVEFEMGGGLGFDTITHIGAALGNVYTYANTGLEMRLGLNLPRDFGISLIRPAGETNAPADPKDPRIGGRWIFGIHLFFSVDGKAVARDIFLDGNTFVKSHDVDKKNFLADIAGGICLTAGRLKIAYAQVLRTKEFEEQESAHQFGSFTISFTY